MKLPCKTEEHFFNNFRSTVKSAPDNLKYLTKFYHMMQSKKEKKLQIYKWQIEKDYTSKINSVAPTCLWNPKSSQVF